MRFCENFERIFENFKNCYWDLITFDVQLTLILVLSPFRLEIWNNTPSKSATVTSIDSGLLLVG